MALSHQRFFGWRQTAQDLLATMMAFHLVGNTLAQTHYYIRKPRGMAVKNAMRCSGQTSALACVWTRGLRGS